VDDDNAGSLWANQGSSSSLFTYQNDKHTGDMVIINVLENLRNQISAELKRTFPDKPKRGSEAAKEGEGQKKAAQAPAATPNAQDNEMDMKVYDKISGTVMEEISKDYIVLRGRKDVIFKKEKRSIEVQALVSRKDIMENDYVNSDKLLESRVFILGRDNQ
jgi:flagellar L-ring protein precursor FlgH